MESYNFAVWATQGGGLVRIIDGDYYFITDPDCPGLHIGDVKPKQWSIVAANERARIEDEEY